MVSADVRRRLERSLEHVFQEPSMVIDTFSSILDTYPLESLEKIEDDDHLESVLKEISGSEKVRGMQEWIGLEIEGGQSTLDTAVLGIVLNNLPQSRIIPRDKLKNIKDYSFQEVWAYVHESGRIKRVAMGLFPLSESLDDVIFTPDTVFYNENLEWNIRPGEKPTLKLHEGVFLRRVTKSIVFTDEVDINAARKAIKEIISYMVGKSKNSSLGKNPYQAYENRIVDRLRSMFPDIINENRSINYGKLYSIFELARRKNIDIGSYMKEGEIARIVMEAVERFIPLPYAVVSTRTKQRERAFEKVIESFYDLRAEGYQGGEKSFRDMYGIRIILPAEKDVYNFLGQLKKTLGVKVVRDENGKLIEKDYIKKPRPNGYKTYHIAIEFAEREYDVQIRTHEMDYMAEKDHSQSHEGKYTEEKIKLIQSTPLPVRKVVSTLLGLYYPTNMAV